ncbi:MAG: zinc ribbon domain-containing protein [Phycisphaerales bacterium]|nr:zinc ribbon domain-containing protein [Phycisphaerales bacterium]
MPIYEYVCSQCGHAFEKLVASSKAKPKCEQCGSVKLERQFSTFSAHGAPAPCSAMSQCQAAAVSGGSACGSGGCCPHAH